jgi:phage regulator Rha-like protein
MGGLTIESISARILIIRGLRVMLDIDLAMLYGVPTKQLNQQVKRNLRRFPADFMFQLTAQEREDMWSQYATTSQRKRRADSAPFAFTEHGCLMLANILRSARAEEVSVLIVRAFVRLRSLLATNADLATRVAKLETEFFQQGRALASHEKAILKLLAEIRQLTNFPESSRRGIGFTANIEDKEESKKNS